MPAARGEYDAYVAGVYRLLARGASAEELAAHLAAIETEAMGGRISGAGRLEAAARRLLQLDVSLEVDAGRRGRSSG